MAEMTRQLITGLNEICTYLAEGEAWHRRAANQCRRHYIRGWGRWHDTEADSDAECRTRLEKMLVDNLKYVPTITTDSVQKAESYTIDGTTADFKRHHTLWLDRENRLIASLNAVIQEMRAQNIELYEKLCKLQSEVQNEAMRVEMTYGRLELAGWNGHDIGVCSKWIHQYFECEYKGGKIDFNIG